MNDMKHTILDKIEAGQVAMRPYWQFVLLSVLFTLCLAFVMVVLVYTLSLITYLMQLSGATYASGFGMYGLTTLLLAVPVRVALLALLILVLLHVLVKRFSFSYHQPFLYTVVGVTGLVLASSVLVVQSSAHERLHQNLEARDMPALRTLYADRPAPKQLHFGQLTRVTEGEYQLKKLGSTTVTVYVSARTRQPATLPADQPVVVLGDEQNGVIEAKGIRPAPQAGERIRRYREANRTERVPSQLRMPRVEDTFRTVPQ
jgi:hypothetical protein